MNYFQTAQSNVNKTLKNLFEWIIKHFILKKDLTFFLSQIYYLKNFSKFIFKCCQEHFLRV